MVPADVLTDMPWFAALARSHARSVWNYGLPCFPYCFCRLLSLDCSPSRLCGTCGSCGQVVYSFCHFYDLQVIKKSSQTKQARRSSLKPFIKVVNYQHMMPTRYTLDVDLKNVVTPDVVDNSSKKVEAKKEAKKLLEEKFKSGKNRWFFTKLRF